MRGACASSMYDSKDDCDIEFFAIGRHCRSGTRRIESTVPHRVEAVAKVARRSTTSICADGLVILGKPSCALLKRLGLHDLCIVMKTAFFFPNVEERLFGM